MPELAEVEFSRKLSDKLVGKKIEGVWVEDRDFKVFSFPDGSVATDHTTLRAFLVGSVVTRTARKGKQLVLHLTKEGHEGAFYLFVHLGMSGTVVMEGEPHLEYRAFNLEFNGEWPPPYIKLQLDCEGGAKWAFCDIRRFGRLYLLKSDEELAKLAPDALTDLPSEEAFAMALNESDKAVKTILVDQTILLSGLGNWTSDEILYQSAIHPESRASALGPEDITRLRNAAEQVLKTAVERDCQDLPPNWLYQYRWGKGNLVDGMGRAITHIKTGGRSSTLVPEVQKKLEGTNKRKGGSNLASYRKRLNAEKEARLNGDGSGLQQPPQPQP